MDINHSTEEQRQITAWIEDSIKAAEQLLVKVDTISDKLFKSGDLTIFFSLLSRFSYLDYQNLLLLSSQYPQAVDIAGASVWKNRTYQGNSFIKNEFLNKGIFLLAPFTEIKESKLCWFTVKMYDISQTTVIGRTFVKSPYLLNKKEHIDNLLKAMRIFGSNEFDISYRVLNTQDHIKTGINCFAKNRVIYISPKADELEQLSFLIEYIVKTNTDEIYIQELLNYLAIGVRECLFDIWNLPKIASCAPPYETIIDVSVEGQKLFLEKAQYWVRSIEDCVLCEYMERSEDKDIIYDDIL